MQLSDRRPDVAFVALHGRDGEDGTVQELLEVMGIPFTGSGVSACIRAADKVLAKHAMRDGGIPTPDFYAFNETAFEGLGRGPGAAGDRGAAPVPDRGQAGPAGIGARDQVRADGGRRAGGAGGRLLLRPQGAARALRPRARAGRLDPGDGDGRAAALPIVEAVPEEEDFYDFEARYEIGRTRFVCPAQLDDAVAERASSIALETYRLLGCAGFARVDLMMGRDGGELFVLELNPIPGLTETSLLPQAAEAAGISFDQLVERILAAVPFTG